jgi:Domain of unknown function (DUF4185)
MSKLHHVLAIVACAGCSGRVAGTTSGGDGGVVVVAPDGAMPVDGSTPTLPVVQQTSELCKLLNNTNASDPTANDVQFRANMLGADLGIPVETGDELFLFFGDTIGFDGIWGDGQSHPDAVGFAADASQLCTGLGIITLSPADSIGPTVDARIAADFAGGSMLAPANGTLDQFIHNPAGAGDQRFANLPGDFEVPSGAFAYGGSIYLFYTTVASETDTTMVGSYLAKWSAPSTTAIPSYQILYAIDERADANGPLYGDFVNISAEVAGDYVYLFGTGQYRASPIHVARKLLSTLDTPGGFELLDSATGTWSTSRGAPIVTTAGYGETSARYFAELGLWMILAEEITATSNRIVAHFAAAPEGPWSDSMIVADMAAATFHSTYCCAVDDNCEGAQFMDCDRTGFYGSYLMPAVVPEPNGFAVTYTLSSFDPYDVALFQTSFARY